MLQKICKWLLYKKVVGKGYFGASSGEIHHLSGAAYKQLGLCYRSALYEG